MAVSFGSRSRSTNWDDLPPGPLRTPTGPDGGLGVANLANGRYGYQPPAATAPSGGDTRGGFESAIGSGSYRPRPRPTDVYAGYQAPTSTDAFEAAIRSQYAPRPAASPASTTAGYTPPDDAAAQAFIDAVRASGGRGFGQYSSQEVSPQYWADRAAAGTDPFVQWRAGQEIQNVLGPVGGQSTGVGDGGAAAAAAASKKAQLDALMSFLQGQQTAVGTRYDEYNQMLADATAKAIADIGAAGAQTVGALGEIDPMAAFQYDVPPTAMPQVAGANYLQKIGASTADVDAARALSQQLMGQQLGMGERFAAAEADALAKERQARLAAAQLQSQSALDATSAQRLALQAQVDAQRNAELQQLAQAILEAQLNYG